MILQKEISIDEIQGYCFSHPVDADTISTMMFSQWNSD